MNRAAVIGVAVVGLLMVAIVAAFSSEEKRSAGVVPDERSAEQPRERRAEPKLGEKVAPAEPIVLRDASPEVTVDWPNPKVLDKAEALSQTRRALELNDANRAQAFAERCLYLDPENRDCRTQLVLACSRSGDFACMRKLNADCLEKDPTSRACLSDRVRLHLQADDMAAAEADVERLRELRPDDGFTFMAEATLLRAKGEDQQARAAYRRACDAGLKVACQHAEPKGE